MSYATRRLCISLHDVAPATLSDCRATLDFLDDLGVRPVALLVVPDYHRTGRADRDSAFCDYIRHRERLGDEIVLHGFRHLDAGGPPTGPRDWLERRVYTDREGEFASLDDRSARALILRGLAVLRAAGWQPQGFVAPAWLMSPGTRMALANLPLQYCATRDAVLLLAEGRRLFAPTLVASTRSTIRRALSPAWNRAVKRCCGRAKILRAALHPRDIASPGIRSMWRELLAELAERTLITEGGLVAERQSPKATRVDSSTRDSSGRTS